MSTKIIIRFDDVCKNMNWDVFLYIKRHLKKLQIKSLLGVIPENKDSELNYFEYREKFFDYIFSYKDYGDTIAQHGTYHKYTTNHSGKLKINNKSEFAGNSYKYQYDLLKIGKEILQSYNCWQPVFMAPSHSFDDITIKALKDLEFKSITDGYGFYPYKKQGIYFVPQISSRPFNLGFGLATVCIHVNSLSNKEIKNFIKFIQKNRSRIISYEEYKSIKKPPEFVVNTLEFLSNKSITKFRKVRNFIRNKS